MTPELITIDDAARLMQVSTSTVYRMLYAREWEIRISKGEKKLSDVPSAIRAYIGTNFPERKYLGPKLPRLVKNEFDEWFASKLGMAA